VLVPYKEWERKYFIDLANRLIENCSQAQIDATTFELAEGYLPSAFRILSKWVW
jgi:hypothetical protein